MYLRYLLCLSVLSLRAGFFADAPKAPSSQEILPSVWATLIDYYPQTTAFKEKIKATKGSLLPERFESLYQLWLKRNHASLTKALDNFLNYNYRSTGNAYEIFWNNGFEPPTTNTLEKILLMIHIQGKNPELFSVLGDLLLLNHSPELACRAYERAIEFGHPQKDRLKKMQELAFRSTGTKNVKLDVNRVKKTLKSELLVIAEWQTNKDLFIGDSPLWDHQLRVWQVPIKKRASHRQILNKNRLIGGIVLSSISLIVGLLLLQAFEKKGWRKPCLPCTPDPHTHTHH